jgi:Tfp pilus assembly protein PilF
MRIPTQKLPEGMSNKKAATYSLPPLRRILKPLWFCLGVLLLAAVLLELGLRVSGRGYTPTVLLENPDGTLRANPNFSRRILKPGTVVPLNFQADPGTAAAGKRILILGDSSASGSHGAANNFARQLDQLLDDSYQITQLNFPAADSHVIRLLASEATQEADIIIVHAGHYEYVGPFSGTTPLSDQLLSNPAVQQHLGFQSSRLRQWIQVQQGSDLGTVYSGIYTFRGSQTKVRERDRQPYHAACLENFTALARTLKGQGKRVIFCVPAVNIRDAAPFNSNYGESLSDENKAELVQLMHVGGYNYKAGKDPRAIQLLTNALTIDEHFAQPHFILAKIYEKNNQAGLARAHYERAVKFDGIPLRADTGIRNAIVQAAADAEVELVNLQQLLAAESTNQIPGGEWFYDHIHLNARGNQTVARALYKQITGQEAQEVMQVPEEDPIVMAAFLRDLTRPPFSYRYANNEFTRAMRASLQGMTNQVTQAHGIAYRDPREECLTAIDAALVGEAPLTALPKIKALLDENPYDLAALIRESQMLRLTKQEEPPRRQAKLARKHAKSPDALIELAEAYVQDINPRDALKTFEKVLAMDQANMSAFSAAAALMTEQGRFGEALHGLSQALRHEPENVAIHENAAMLYGNAKNYPMALQHLQRVLEFEPGRESALALVQRYQASGSETARELNNASTSHMKAARYAEALAGFQKALELYPDAPMALNNLAYLLATCPDENFRDGKQAVALATRLLDFAKDAPQPGFRATLAAAYAETGDFEQAVKTIIQAIDDAETLGQRGSIEQFLEIMGTYKNGQAYRHVAQPN